MACASRGLSRLFRGLLVHVREMGPAVEINVAVDEGRAGDMPAIDRVQEALWKL